MIVDVILPCLNEASALPWMLDGMPAGFRPIVVDNGSTDGSGEIARLLGATVVPEQARGFITWWCGLPDAADEELLDHCRCPVLDVGCGPGRLTVALTERGIPALGVDISRAAVARVRQAGGS